MRADVGLEFMRGSNDYTQDTFNLDINLSSSTSLNFTDEQVVMSSYTSLVKTYSADLNYKFNEYFNIGVNGSVSPETDDAKSAGWGANAAYNSGGDDFSWGISLPYSQTTLAQYWQASSVITNARTKKTRTVASSGWTDLVQSNIAPSINFGLFGAITLNMGYSYYSYNRDLDNFSNNLSRLTGTINTAKGARSAATTASFGNLPSLIYGFPVNIYSAGISDEPLDSLTIGYDWSDTTYALEQPEIETSTLSVSYLFGPVIKVKASYESLSNNDVYKTAGIQWLW